MQVCWLRRRSTTFLQFTMQASKSTSRSTFFFSPLPSAFICYSHQSMSILFGHSLKQKDGAQTRTGSTSTPRLLPAWWGTSEPCSVWVWRWTLSCSSRAARGRTDPRPDLSSCASPQPWRPCKCTTLSKCPRTPSSSFMFCHFVRVRQCPSAWSPLFLTAFICWSAMKRGSLYRLYCWDWRTSDGEFSHLSNCYLQLLHIIVTQARKQWHTSTYTTSYSLC